MGIEEDEAGFYKTHIGMNTGCDVGQTVLVRAACGGTAENR